MKKFSLLFAFLSFTSCLIAQYQTPNTGVHWTLDSIALHSPATVQVSGNEYLLTTGLVISETDSLFLDTDLILKINPDVEIEVEGFFSSDADDILITAVDPENIYEGFWFYDGSGAYFRNTKIEYGGGLKVVTENFTMLNCEVSNNGVGSSTGSAISFSKGNPIIMDSYFYNNDKPALSSAANSSVGAMIIGNYFEGNHQLNGNAPQINMGPSGVGDTIRIMNNIVVGDRSLTKVGGISASSLLGVENNILVQGNTVTDNRYGITSMGPASSGIIADNIIEDNDTEGAPMLGGSGINLYGTSLVYLSGNQIRRNLWGLTLQNEALTNLGSDDEEDFNPGENIFSENGNGGTVYAMYNNTPNPVKALHNCWIEGQQSTIEEVEDVIFHQTDDPSLGEVFYDPFECGIEMAVTDLEKDKINIYPNPAKTDFFVTSPVSGVLQIFDMNGKLVKTQHLSQGKNQIQIRLPKGVYNVLIKNQDTQLSEKLIVR